MSRRTFLRAALHAFVGSGLASGGTYYYSTRIEPQWPQVERVSIPLRGLSSGLEGFTIVQMSDFHLSPPHTTSELVLHTVTMANRLDADLVVLTGDYVLEHVDAIFELAPVLARLNARYGVYAIVGNHDIWTDVDVVKQGLREAGLPVLLNEGVDFSVNGARLFLAGLDDAWSGTPNLDLALARARSDDPVILLMHEPDVADTYAQDGRVALQLSGHSHGGQVRMPGMGAIILPQYGRKYDQGLYQVQDMMLYTNRGIGVVGGYRCAFCVGRRLRKSRWWGYETTFSDA